MPTTADLKQSRFLKKEDIGAGKLLTIKGYTHENVAMESQPKEMKYCLHFNELEKPLVLNSVNGDCIEEIVGSNDLDDWAGHVIVLFTDPNVMMGTKRTGGIRVRAPKPQALAPTTPAPAPKPQPRPVPKPAPVPEPEVESPADDDVPF